MDAGERTNEMTPCENCNGTGEVEDPQPVTHYHAGDFTDGYPDYPGERTWMVRKCTDCDQMKLVERWQPPKLP